MTTRILWIAATLTLCAAAIGWATAQLSAQTALALVALCAGLGGAGWLVRRRMQRSQGYDPYTVLAADFAQQGRMAKAAGHDISRLPCYIVIGPRQSGKSTLLAAMALQGGAPDASHQQEAGCQFWLSKTALFIDTPGQLNSGPAAGEAWDAFVRLVKRRIGLRRIKGVLLSADIKTMAPGGLSAQSLNLLSHQLTSLQQALQLRLPTYVMLTQADGMTGFTQTFAELDAEARGQILGLTLPEVMPQADSQSPLALVDRYLAELYTALQHHAALRLDTQTRLEARQPIFLFPKYMAELGPFIHDFLTRLFVASGFAEAPWLRGVYFCSAGAPVSTQLQKQRHGLVAGIPSPALAPSWSEPAASQRLFIDDFVRRLCLQTAGAPLR